VAVAERSAATQPDRKLARPYSSASICVHLRPIFSPLPFTTSPNRHIAKSPNPARRPILSPHLRLVSCRRQRRPTIIPLLIQGIGSIGFFSSRAFLPAFITACALRYGPHIGWLADSFLLKDMADAPVWFTSNTCLIILGALAALELVATKVPEARQLLTEVDKYLKSGMALVTYLGIASAADGAFAKEALQQAGMFDVLPAAVVAIAVYFISAARGAVLSIFMEADEDDDAGVQGLLSWAEDVWSVAGPLLLILFPIVMLILIGLVAGLFVLARKWAEAREEKAKVPCTHCGQSIYAHAMACPACQTPVAEPKAVAFFGGSKKQPDTNLDAHPYALVEKKRCPVCATRFTQRIPRQTCEACTHELFADADFARTYVNRVGSRLPLVLVVSFLFSLVPVIGLIPGVIYYRLALIAPYRRYIPLSRSFLLIDL